MRSCVLWMCKNRLLWASVCNIVAESCADNGLTEGSPAYGEFQHVRNIGTQARVRRVSTGNTGASRFFVVLVWRDFLRSCIYFREMHIPAKKSKFGDKRQLCVGPASQGNEQHKNGIWDYTGSTQADARTNRPQFSDEAPGMSYYRM